MPNRHLHLMASGLPDHERQQEPSAEPMRAEPMPSAESSALKQMRLERDAALEDVAFLREQLRSTEAFYTYRIEYIYERLHAEHRSLLDDLARMSAERQHRSLCEDLDREEEMRAAPTPPDAPSLPRRS